ncbi:fimbrial biogenesis chaperone [Arsenophonus sp. PmNCSU2021_1]|uniref:fimbrial biogenesis chaperone n=1 Tax=Arsenophonus sp. PmNCSU2021_1 TaxID=3118989 RepID=UPI002FF40A0B
MKKFLLFIILIISSKNILANIVLQGTRIIYYEAKGNVTVQLTNNGKLPALVQSWVDDGNINSTPEKSHSPFYVFPPIVKIAGLKGQQLKIKMISHKLPKNRESVFYLNILDIPLYPENTQGKSVHEFRTNKKTLYF